MADVQQKYDEEFKASAVRLSYESNRPAPELAGDPGISDEIAYQRRQQYADAEKNTSASPSVAVEAPQMEDARLRMRQDAEIYVKRNAEPAARQIQAEESDEIALADVWNALKRGRVKLLAWLLICALLGGIGGAGYVLLRAEDRVAAVVQFGYDGIESGHDPRGAMLDVSKIKGPHIVQPALSQLGYEGGDKKVNAETVRQAIAIEGQLPKDVIDRLTVVNTIAANSNSVSYLEKVLDINYFPSRYTISLDAGKLGISSQAARELLDGILGSYDQYFDRTYADVQLMGTAIRGLDSDQYDYTEALDVIGAQMDTMTDYVNELRARGSSFRSAATGYAFADINGALDLIRTTDLSSVAALVFSYNLTKDRALLTNYLNYKLEEKNQQLQVAQQVLAAVNGKLNNYPKEAAAETDNSNAGQPTNEYDRLIEQSIEGSRQVAQLRAQIGTLQSQVEKARSVSAEAASGEYENLCAEAGDKLKGVVEKLQNWADVIDQSAGEYFLTGALSNAFEVKAPAQDTSDGRLVRMVLFALIGAIGGLGIVLMLYLIGVCFSLAVGDKRRRRSGFKPGVSA